MRNPHWYLHQKARKQAGNLAGYSLPGFSRSISAILHKIGGGGECVDVLPSAKRPATRPRTILFYVGIGLALTNSRNAGLSVEFENGLESAGVE
jgi:hypothetical protein